MQRVGFTMRVKAGAEEEYVRRHREVWPELLEDLRAAGCRNYSIFMRPPDLFAYMEVEDWSRFLATMGQSDANRRWQEHMRDILELDVEPAIGHPPPLVEAFHLD
jgi:L-rhamnose mutarotase